MAILRKIIAFYKRFSIAMVSLAIILMLINIGLWVSIPTIRALKKHITNPVSSKYKSKFSELYPDLEWRSVNSLLNETWSRPYAFEPFTQFKERAFHGHFVNVSEEGFRLSKNQSLWPPDSSATTIYLFGGSTTFGYGLPDSQTIASFLQTYIRDSLHVPANVFNWGRSNYYSSQELNLFMKLTRESHPPQIAVFIDGLNDFFFYEDQPEFTVALAKFFDSNSSVGVHSFAYNLSTLVARLPIYAICQSFSERIKDLSGYKSCQESDNADINAKVWRRYQNFMRAANAVAAEYHIKTLFVWQPIPLYKYDLQYHQFPIKDLEGHVYVRHGYEYVCKYLENHSLKENFLFAANMQEHLAMPLYIDKMHYSAKMCGLIAALIGKQLVEKNILPEPMK